MAKPEKPPAGTPGGHETEGQGGEAAGASGESGKAPPSPPMPREDVGQKLADAERENAALRAEIERARAAKRRADEQLEKADREAVSLRDELRKAQRKTLELRSGFVELAEAVTIDRIDTKAQVDAKPGDILSMHGPDDTKAEQARIGPSRRVIPVDRATFEEMHRKGLTVSG